MSFAGQILGGRYRLGARLGQGGMGTVYEATQQDLGRRVAVKLLDPRLAEDPAQIERFRREALAAAALGHPNIVAVTDFQWQPPEPPFLVMEHLTGQSLAALLERERTLPPARIAFVLAQVLSALAAAHDEGIVHRDVKPDNVFLVSGSPVPDLVKVLDFGIAKLGPQSGNGARLTSTGAMLGTPAYMAPEQARGADVDARADVYAVGATLYQALSGRLPFDEPSLPAMLFAIVEKTPPSLASVRPDLPPELVAVVEKAMAKDRDARFQSAEEMRAALAPWAPLTATTLPSGTSPDVGVTAPTLALADGTPAPVSPVVVRSNPPVAAQPTPVASSSTPHPPRRSSAATIVLGIVGGLVAITAIVMGSLVLMVRGRDARDARETSGSAWSVHDVASVSAALSASSAASPPPPAEVASTLAAPSASSSAAEPARKPPPARRYGGKAGYVSGSDFGSCPSCDWRRYKLALDTRKAAVSACFAASVHEPPVHENPEYQVHVGPTGAIGTVTALGGGAPKLDRCFTQLLRSLPVPKPGGDAGTFNVGFRGECPTFECR